MHLLRAHFPAILISLAAGCFFLVIGLAQHAHFATSGWDFGIFMQALYHYAHGILGPNTVRGVPTLLGDHLEPIMFLLVPLWWIFRENTLFVVQSFAVTIGGLGVYTAVMAREDHWKRLYATAALMLFCVHWSLTQAVTFDYHNNVLGMMLLPWIIVAVQYKKWLWMWLLTILLLMTKETAGLLVMMLGLGMVLTTKKEERLQGALLISVGILYFLLAIKVLIPFFAQGSYAHLTYDRLGSSLGDMLLFMLQHPLQTLQMFFDAPEKLQFWKYTLASGGFLLLLWPRLLLLALPLIAMKMLSSKDNHWGIWFHYQVELSVLISIALGWTCMRITRPVAVSAILLLLSINIWLTARMPLADRFTPAHSQIARIFSPLSAWQQAAQEALRMIPEDASVSVNNTLVPHLASRHHIFLFPEYDRAEYILLHEDTYNVWPLATREDMEVARARLAADPEFEVIFAKEGIVLYKRASKAN